MNQNRPELAATAATHRATILIAQAIDLLDAQGGVPDVTMHLDLALRSLRRHLSNDDGTEEPTL